AHGQRVAIDQQFAITDPDTQRTTMMAHPGDPSAPLGEIVNCRCGVLLASRGLRYTPSQSAPAPAP
ncbi:MAG TPA: hypothetical protein PKY87_15440, partial [Terricaulis sp.]|nr:hypothetical protein [Terricaulis sp.]